MSLKTESAVVRAADESNDLAAMIKRVLLLWRLYANGINQVTVPSKEFIVFPLPTKLEKSGVLLVSCGVIAIETRSFDVPVYYQPDSDYFSESFGIDNLNYMKVEQENYQIEVVINFPLSWLFLEKESLIEVIKGVRKCYERSEKEKMLSKEEQNLKLRLEAIEQTKNILKEERK